MALWQQSATSKSARFAEEIKNKKLKKNKKDTSIALFLSNF